MSECIIPFFITRRFVVESEVEKCVLTRHKFFVPSLNAKQDMLLVSADYIKTVVYKHLQVFCKAVTYIVSKLET